MPDAPAPLRVLLRRARALRCPACGRGAVFAGGFRRAPVCSACGRRLDRDEGHWLGGAEVLMALSWGAGALLLFPVAAFADLPAAGLHLLAVLHLALSVALYRPSRALFLALDFAVDPSDAGPPRPPGDGESAPTAPAPTAPGRSRARRRRRAPAVPVPA